MCECLGGKSCGTSHGLGEWKFANLKKKLFLDLGNSTCKYSKKHAKCLDSFLLELCNFMCEHQSKKSCSTSHACKNTLISEIFQICKKSVSLLR
jgi:uncharacterized protein YutD